MYARSLTDIYTPDLLAECPRRSAASARGVPDAEENVYVGVGDADADYEKSTLTGGVCRGDDIPYSTGSQGSSSTAFSSTFCLCSNRLSILYSQWPSNTSIIRFA